MDEKERGKKLINSIMRTGEKDLCVTTWGATLRVEKIKRTRGLVTVSDPNAVDAGMDISINDIILIARKKYI